MATETLRVIPLGGLGAIGKNMTVLEYGDALIVVDAGLMFPDEEMLGIDLVLPDFSYVVEHRDKALGVLLTHGHEDHTGALPYLLKEAEMPVYGTRLTLGLVNGKLGEHGLQGKIELNEVTAETRLRLGPFDIEFLEVCHSIPDGVAMAIHTPVGTVVHYRGLQVGPDAGRLPPDRDAPLRAAGQRRGAALAVGLHQRGDPRLHQTGTVGRPDAGHDLRPGSRADHRRVVRQPHPPHPTDLRRRPSSTDGPWRWSGAA